MPVPLSTTRTTTCSPAFDDRDGRLDAQPSAGRHRVAGVDHQVHQHLVDQSRVGVNGQRPRRQQQLQVDVFAEHAPHHFREARHQLVQIDVLRLHDLAAAERQQLARQAGGAVRRIDDVARRHLPRRGIVLALQQREREPLDDGEDVVEVVRDAAGELPDGLHLLRVAQLGFELALAGDVAADAEHRRNLAVGDRAAGRPASGASGARR